MADGNNNYVQRYKKKFNEEVLTLSAGVFCQLQILKKKNEELNCRQITQSSRYWYW